MPYIRAMLKAATLNFLAQLAVNNHKDWFDAHRAEYQAARQDFLRLTQELINGLSLLDPAIQAAQLDAKKCVMRINRDIRFSADKTPYKANFFAFINPGGKKSSSAGYYLQVKPGDSFMGGGVYMLPNADLKKVRYEIEDHLPEWERILAEVAFRQLYKDGVLAPQKLSRPPQGFSAESPALPYLKMKGFYTHHSLSDSELQSEGLSAQLLEKYGVAKPLVDFLNRALVP